MNKNDIKHLPRKKPQEPKWYQKVITPDQFDIKQNSIGLFFAHHHAWKKTVWIGPYETEEEISKVIASYATVTKKPFGKRKELKSVHSIIIEEKDW